MELDLDRVAMNARKASTEDLLDRVTAYRTGMEPAALAVIEAELAHRGITPDAVNRHAAAVSEAMTDAAGYASVCSYCPRPALVVEWGWYRLWNALPLFPIRYRYCREHLPPL